MMNERKKIVVVGGEKKSRVARLAFLFIFSAAILCEPSLFVNASSVDTSSITGSFNNLIDIATAIISSIGTLVTLWGISEWGIGMQSHDGTAQAQSFKRIGGGLIMILAPQILAILV